MSENNAKQQMVEDDPIEVRKAKRAALIAAGVRNGGMFDVLVKAINICTECIGLG